MNYYDNLCSINPYLDAGHNEPLSGKEVAMFSDSLVLWEMFCKLCKKYSHRILLIAKNITLNCEQSFY